MAKTRLTLVLFSAAAIFFVIGSALQFALGNILVGMLFAAVAIVGAVLAVMVHRGRLR